MKVLGYILCALGVVIGALMLVDVLFLESAGQIWDPLDYAICVALAVCVIIGIRDHLSDGGTFDRCRCPTQRVRVPSLY